MVDPLVSSALIGGGASLLGGIFGNKSSKKEARRSRDFTREQMQNKHQWQVADLRKAGLNPVLSAGVGSASIGGSAAASQQNPAADLGTYVSSALQAKRLKAEIKQINALTKKTDAEAQNTRNISKVTNLTGTIAQGATPITDFAINNPKKLYKNRKKVYDDYGWAAKKAITSAKSAAKDKWKKFRKNR